MNFESFRKIALAKRGKRAPLDTSTARVDSGQQGGGKCGGEWGCCVANILNILCANITCESDRCALIAPQIASDCAHIAYTPLVQLELRLLLHCNSVKFNFPIKCQKFVAAVVVVVVVVVCLACCCVKFFASN